MTTSEPTNQKPIQHQLFALDFHAKTSQSQVEAKASRRIQGLVSSTNSSESYAWYDQDSSSWKTSQRSLLTGWTPFSESFTRQGMMQNGHVFQRQWLEPVTSETGGGQLPTPRAQEPGRTNIGYGDSLKEGVCKQIGIPTSKYPNLLPTPLASDPERKAKFKQGGTPLMGALLPTPRARDWKGKTRPDYKERGYGATLPDAVAQLPTPRASEWKGCGQVGSKSSLDWEKKGYLSGVLNETCSPQTGEATHLNPSFVEEMMGYPIGWTDLEH